MSILAHNHESAAVGSALASVYRVYVQGGMAMHVTCSFQGAGKH